MLGRPVSGSPAVCRSDSALGMRLIWALLLDSVRSVCITDLPGSCAVCTPPVPPARDMANRCWQVSAGCNECDGVGRLERTGQNTDPRTTTSTPRSPAAFLKTCEVCLRLVGCDWTAGSVDGQASGTVVSPIWLPEVGVQLAEDNKRNLPGGLAFER